MPALKFARFLGGMLVFLAAASWLRFRFRDSLERRAAILKLNSRIGAQLLKTLRIRVTLRGVIPESDGRGRLIVSNHISYLDVALLGLFFNARFVTSTEVERSFGLGSICKFAECLFVSRRSPARLRSDLARLQETLRSGTDVAVFPEATSSRGTEILPFHRGLLNVGSNRIVPCVISYSRPEVAYIDDDEFLSHLWRLVKTPRIEAMITVLPERRWQAESDLRDSTIKLHQEMSVSKVNAFL